MGIPYLSLVREILSHALSRLGMEAA